MKKLAFTMIELIFVIVILGILAAVAIPKLGATRDDAERVKTLEDIRNASKEIIAFYTARGEDINFSYLEDDNRTIVSKLVNQGWIKIENDTKAYVYSDKLKKTVCITYITDKAQIQIETNKSNNDNLCKQTKVFIFDRNYSILNSAVNF